MSADGSDDWLNNLPPPPPPGDGAPLLYVGPVELTEDGVALAFTRAHKGRALFDHHLGRWFWWQEADGIWRRDERRAAVEHCRTIVRGASDIEKPKVQATVRRKSFMAGAEFLAQGDPAHAVTSEVWDRDRMLLGCPGATVDLRTGVSRAPAASDFITRQAAVAPDLAGHCPTWERFLEDATGGDEAMIAFLQTIFGYSLTGEIKDHAAFWLYGDGGNGKSVFLNTLRGILGSYGQAASMDTFTASKYASHPTDLAALRGARLVTVSEISEGRNLDEQRFKQLTGGDPVRARFMRQDEFEYVPQFKLLFAGNSRPSIRSVDSAMKRRLRMIPFNHKPARPDPDLEERLKAEWPGILRWAIRGCQAWRSEGLGQPGVVVAATAEYFGQQDLFSQWLEERCEVALGDRRVWSASAELFADWRKWVEAAGEFAGNSKSFGERLARKGFIMESARVAGVKARGWRGLRLLGSQL